MAYLDHWKKTVQERDGYSEEDKESMLLSKTTENGIRITSKYEVESNFSHFTLDIFSIILLGVDSRDIFYQWSRMFFE